MTRTIAQHLAGNPGFAQHVAGNLSGDAPMRLRHTVHLLQHGVHGGWLTAIIFLLIMALPFIIALAGIIYRRTQRGSAQASPAYRPVSAAPWQSGMASSATPLYGSPAYPSAPIASAAPAWTAPQANRWAAPAPQWTR
ncbi:hypothetical protein FZI85_27890 [Mycobacterium sp. CBMA293]|uniref:Uncharacterized protein n=1 Tax=Mycolicibacterium sp. CBMA 213 TaxID=1968788 RepID=A0A1S6GKY0_9MYCO|nr:MULTISPECIES: hypothetical protein [unclassified Mycolicibacterium]AQS22516.1 hypothetical protein pCBMA213_2_00152 [Mycolicibacterium sp. CBMA 213]MUL48415.1 hypothetical protein [Mycolicibacterium sp. CBMA 360]MUL62427.1 hypothetical protein [Mycolicibacterium sp. CBMA 335]MUM04564.1 hypothetical protein [Mycolicibacterium sp. CBMA 213]MUM14827.1 hypothetical protein [Mycolicibacterium sp. CBMA 293]